MVAAAGCVFPRRRPEAEEGLPEENTGDRLDDDDAEVDGEVTELEVPQLRDDLVMTGPGWGSMP